MNASDTTPPQEAKGFLQSNTIRWLIVAALPAILKVFGIQIAEAETQQAASALVELFAVGMAMYGRKKASGPLVLGGPKSPLLVFGLLSVVCGLTGCGTLERTLYKPEVQLVQPASTNLVEREMEVPVISTNLVEVHRTNEAGKVEVLVSQVLETNQVKRVVQVPVVLPAIYATNYVVNPLAAKAIQTGANFIPIPGGGLIGGVLVALLGAGGSWLAAKRRGDKLAGAMANSFDAYRKEVAKAITSAGPEVDRTALKAMKMSQDAAGVGAEVARIVHKFTESTGIQ